MNPPEPAASVILCVRNAERDLRGQLTALAGQDFPGAWELVVVDNASSDRGMDVVRGFAGVLPGLRVVPAPRRPGLAYARNVGARAARGPVLAFCDADDEVRPGWLAALVEGVRTADLVGGRLCFGRVNDERGRFWRGANPTDAGLPTGHRYLPHVIGANFAVRRAVYLALGGCDERFVGSSDEVDLSWRAQRAGYRVGYAAGAVVDYRLRSSARAAARQRHGYGMSESVLYRKHRPMMRRTPAREVLANWWYLTTRCHHLLRGPMLRGRWLSDLAYRTGRLHGSWRARVWFP